MILVIPCYNEAGRLDEKTLMALCEGDRRVSLLLVDDGSTDDTRGVLERLAAQAPHSIDVLALERNQGKGEAVRQGFLRAIERGAAEVGFGDADLATPAAELLRLVETLRSRPQVEVLIGARVALAGRDIKRRAARHYLGRVFSTCASMVLRMPIYDTQCGAKVFRVTPRLRYALSEPFHSRWAFDVELLGRLLRGSAAVSGLPDDALVEEPLHRWRDPGGSKLGLISALRAGLDLVTIAHALRHWSSGSR